MDIDRAPSRDPAHDAAKYRHMDLEWLLERAAAAKKGADSRAEAKCERVASDFTTYIGAIKERVREPLDDVKGIGPLS
jgi:hypothetical protein